MKRNDEVIDNWCCGIDSQNQNVTGDGRWLISYNTAIAYRLPGGSLLLSSDNFSVTTARHLGLAYRFARGACTMIDAFTYGETRPFTEDEVPDVVRQSLVNAFNVKVDRFDSYKRSDYKVKLYTEFVLGLHPYHYGARPFVEIFNEKATRFGFRRFDMHATLRRLEREILPQLTVLRLKGKIKPEVYNVVVDNHINRTLKKAGFVLP
jgi:hypothetical protein